MSAGDVQKGFKANGVSIVRTAGLLGSSQLELRPCVQCSLLARCAPQSYGERSLFVSASIEQTWRLTNCFASSYSQAPRERGAISEFPLRPRIQKEKARAA